MLIVVLTIAAGLIWYERRLLSLVQDRYGPNRVGPVGLLQVLADTFKILFKEDWMPPFADRRVFVVAPSLVLITALLSFIVVPVRRGLGRHRPQHRPAVLPRHVVAGRLQRRARRLVVAQQVLAGRRPARRRADGELRGLHGPLADRRGDHGRLLQPVRHRRGAAAQLWYVVPQFIGFVVFLVAGFAETRRIPFDLVEAESELVAGYHTEYSGMKFGMFLVGEYVAVTLISALIVTLFFGGWLGPWLPGVVWFLIKTFIFISLFIIVRGTFPRPRYDQLMALGWKAMLPLSLLNLLVTGAIVVARAG